MPNSIPLCLHELVAEIHHSVAQLDCRADRSQGVVFVELGQSEERDHCIADELLDFPLMALEDLPCNLGVALQDPVHRLWVEELPEGHRIDHVCEHHGDWPSSTGRFPSCRRSDRRGRGRQLASCGLEIRVVREHPALEVAQLRARLEPELLGESSTGLAVYVERLRLPPGAVEREHQLRAQALAEGVLCDERPQLRE